MTLYYFTGKLCKGGHIAKRYASNSACVECEKIRRANRDPEQHRVQAANWRAKNREKACQLARERYAKNPERAQKASSKWKDANVEKRRIYYCENREQIQAVNREWRRNNIETARRIYVKSSSLRRATKVKAMPFWADVAAIKKIYDECPSGHHVDHIVPLKGKGISGLHVPWNLQYLTASENSRKSNIFTST